MTKDQAPTVSWRTLLASLAFVALVCGCGDRATEDCAACPNLALQPACEEAAAECDAVPADEQQMCIEEARALCA